MSSATSYRGSGLGLPQDGPGSLATFPRRLVAIVIDWLLCQLIAYGVWGVEWGATGAASFVPLAVFAVENLLLVSTLGTTVGHRLLGLQVNRLAPGSAPPLRGAPGFTAGAIRTALLCLALPALIWDGEGRGMHDRAAGTAIVRVR